MQLDYFTDKHERENNFVKSLHEKSIFFKLISKVYA